MTGAFVLTLDTTAPVVTWGAVDGTTAGELLTVLYTIDEPGITSARLELRDGRRLDMDVAADRLTVLLPADLPDGPATLRAFVADEVLNTAQRTVLLHLTGTIVTPAPEPGGAPAGLPEYVRQPTIRRRKRVHIEQRTRAYSRQALRSNGGAHVTTRHSIRRRQVEPPAPPPTPVPLVAITRSRVQVRTAVTSSVRLRDHTGTPLRSGGRIVKRTDPDVLALLDLI